MCRVDCIIPSLFMSTPSASNIGITIDPDTGDTSINGLFTVTASNTSSGMIIQQNGTGPILDCVTSGIKRLTIDSQGNIGIGTTQPQTSLDLSFKTDALLLPMGTVDERLSTNIAGQMRFNTQYNMMEISNGTTWNQVQTTPFPVTDNMMLHWDAGNTLSYPGTGSTVYNLTTPAINGTLMNTTYSSGAFVFNGINSSLQGTLNNPAGAWTHSISFWMTLNANQSSYATRVDPFQIGNNTATNKYSALDIKNDNLTWYFNNNNTSNAGNIFLANTWYHLVLTYNGGNANPTNKKLFINNVEYELKITGPTHGTTPLDIDANAILTIGSDRLYNTAYFPGKIAKIQIFNRVLTPYEIGNMYYATRASFDIPHWHFPGMIIQNVVKQINQSSAISVSGLNNYDTGIYAIITPRYATSMIYVKFFTNMTHLNNATLRLNLYRNGVNITPSNYNLTYESTSSWFYMPVTRTYYDTPNTTSPLEYRIYVLSGGGTTTYVVHNSSYYSMTLEEIAQ